FLMSMINLGGQAAGEPVPPTPGNVGRVVEMIVGMLPTEPGKSATYLAQTLLGLEGMISIAYNNDRTVYANVVAPRLAGITDTTLH
uniref:hypothetical protein n=1 Tax=Klebsiella michiganensis TaxID=1134687 RepID=UPI0013D831B2